MDVVALKDSLTSWEMVEIVLGSWEGLHNVSPLSFDFEIVDNSIAWNTSWSFSDGKHVRS